MIRRWDTAGNLNAFILLVLWFPHAKAQVSCPSGDVAGIVANGQTCAELVTSSTKVECYDTNIETACCSSCNAQNTGISGCEYGDRTTCFPFLCGTLINEDDCCETCATTTTTVSLPTTITTTILTTTTPPTTTDTSIPTTLTTITTTEPTPPTPAETTTLAPVTTAAPTQATTQDTTTTTAVTGATTQVTTLSVASTFLGESSESKGNKDAAIIGGTIGGVAGLAVVTGVAVFGVYHWKKVKRNKVSDLNVDSLPPKPDGHRPPEVVLPVKPEAQYGNRVIEPKERHKNKFVEPIEPPGSFFTHARPVNIIHEIEAVKEHRAVVYDNSTPQKYDTDTQHFESQNGKKVITKPYLLPPLDTSGLNSTGPLRAEVETKYEDTSREKRKRKHSKTDVKPKTHNIVPNGIDNSGENSVRFLQLTDSSFLTKETIK